MDNTSTLSNYSRYVGNDCHYCNSSFPLFLLVYIDSQIYFQSQIERFLLISVLIHSYKIIIVGSILYSVNLGDSRAVLYKTNGQAIPLSDDHKCSKPSEKERIEKAGASVGRLTRYEVSSNILQCRIFVNLPPFCCTSLLSSLSLSFFSTLYPLVLSTITNHSPVVAVGKVV